MLAHEIEKRGPHVDLPLRFPSIDNPAHPALRLTKPEAVTREVSNLLHQNLGADAGNTKQAREIFVGTVRPPARGTKSQSAWRLADQRSRMNCEGFVTATIAAFHSIGTMAHDDLVWPPSVSAYDHPARRLAVYAFHASYRDDENLLGERGVDVSYETVRR